MAWMMYQVSPRVLRCCYLYVCMNTKCYLCLSTVLSSVCILVVVVIVYV